MRITKSVPEITAPKGATAMTTGDEMSARGPRRGWKMGLLCHRKYREAARPEIRAYFSFCPTITASPRIHGRAVTNIGAVARMTAEETEGTAERTKGTTRRTVSSEKERAGGRGTPSRKRPHFVFLGHPSWSPRIFIVLAAGKNMFYLYFIFFPFFLSFYFSVPLFFFSPCRVSWSETDAAHRGFARGDHEIWSWDTGSPACLRRRNSGYILCSLWFLLTPLFSKGMGSPSAGWKYFGNVSLRKVFMFVRDGESISSRSFIGMLH